MHLHDQSGAADASDGCNVMEEIEREIFEEGRVDCLLVATVTSV
jgi:hypothetical protein